MLYDKILSTKRCNILSNLSRDVGKKSVASCRRHVTRCDLGLQLAMFSKNLCSRCKQCNLALQIMLRCAISLASCVAMVLKEKLHVSCSV